MELVGTAFSIFEHYATTFIDGTIDIQHLKLILEHEKSFIDVCEIFKSRLTLMRTRQKNEELKIILVPILKKRAEELSFLLQHIEWTQLFLTLCKDVEKGQSELICC